ncbi:MAP3K1 [Branchiostoma lanceolatum]|uniref:MAP3K1 protein n=1 Tax=Branchiostoma lanceolatum TaxID=7740 RepID=A0A8J9W241_BRALA|nr:MAP3K1 [Branchiostoma lanceolatum]
MQIHTNTPPSEIPVTSSPVEGDTSAIIAGSCGDQGPASDWSFHLPGNGMRMEVPKSKPGPVKEDEKSQHDKSLLRSLLPSQVTSDLSEEDLVKEAQMTALKTALTRLVQEKPIYLDSDPLSLLSQLSDLIFQNQENEPPSRNCVDTPSIAGLSLQSMVSQSLGTLHDMLSTASTMTNFAGAANQPGTMAPSANQPQEKNPSSQQGHSMTNQLLSTIFISQPEAPASLTNEQSELWTTLQSATARLSLVQENIQSEQVNFPLTVAQMMKNGQESRQHRHARLLDILQQLCLESLKQVLVGAAYCNGKCKQPNCMLAAEVLSCLVDCVKEGTVLSCRGCCSVLSHLLDHHVPRCTERRCPVPYCVHLQERTPSSVEEALGRINAEIGTVGLCAEIVVRTSGDSSFQGLAMADPGIEKLELVLPLGTFGRNILARAKDKDKYVTVKQMDKRSLDVLRRLNCPTPHIVQFFWVQFAENCQEKLQVFFAFEQGGSLQSLLTDHGGLKTDRMWPYLQQVLKAVVYLHSMDIIYLAWTADNIVLDSSHQRAKLSNLSYAVELTEETDEEACVQAVTGLPPQILAPEVHNDLSACHQSDIWGLGCLLFQLREGRLPYPHLSHDHPDSIRQKIAEDGELPIIPESWQGHDRELLKACWQEEAASRPSAQELQTLVARYG